MSSPFDIYCLPSVNFSQVLTITSSHTQIVRDFAARDNYLFAVGHDTMLTQIDQRNNSEIANFFVSGDRYELVGVQLTDDFVLVGGSPEAGAIMVFYRSLNTTTRVRTLENCALGALHSLVYTYPDNVVGVFWNTGDVCSSFLSNGTQRFSFVRQNTPFATAAVGTLLVVGGGGYNGYLAQVYEIGSSSPWLVAHFDNAPNPVFRVRTLGDFIFLSGSGGVVRQYYAWGMSPTTTTTYSTSTTSTTSWSTSTSTTSSSTTSTRTTTSTTTTVPPYVPSVYPSYRDFNGVGGEVRGMDVDSSAVYIGSASAAWVRKIDINGTDLFTMSIPSTTYSVFSKC